ncbi:MAG TPA: hypothetical protein VMQ54_10325, partial [Steroidobacteraceae bacterium]|nr:hypothetical protein [Steroidobacteraceae bacterium]
GAYIENYFNGGADSVPSDGNGPSDGFTFSSNATVQKAGSSASTGDGRFENNPSGQSEILYFAADNSSGTLNTGGSYLNYAAGFSGLSFNYSLAGNSAAYSATVNIWSGLNGTGTLLDSLTLAPNASTVACTSSKDSYCTWSLATTGTTNFGTAESVTFGASSTTNFTEFDGVQLTPVPLPGALLLLGSACGGLFGLSRRGRRSDHR